MNSVKLKIDQTTVISTALLIIALINQVLQIFGISPLPVDDNQITLIISTGFTVSMALWNWWRNNNISQDALKKSALLDDIQKITPIENVKVDIPEAQPVTLTITKEVAEPAVKVSESTVKVSEPVLMDTTETTGPVTPGPATPSQG